MRNRTIKNKGNTLEEAALKGLVGELEQFIERGGGLPDDLQRDLDVVNSRLTQPGDVYSDLEAMTVMRRLMNYIDTGDQYPGQQVRGSRQ